MLIHGTGMVLRRTQRRERRWRADEIRQEEAILVLQKSEAIAADERAAGLLTGHLRSESAFG